MGDVNPQESERTPLKPREIAYAITRGNSYTSRLYQRFPGLLQRCRKDPCYDPLYIHSDLPAHHRYLPACRQDRHQGHRCCERYRLDSHAVIRSTICAESHEASETICPIKGYGLHISAGRFCFIRSAFQKEIHNHTGKKRGPYTMSLS